jgi:UDP-N-acetylmuramate dehydrogenase
MSPNSNSKAQPDNIHTNAELKSLCSFGIGGHARWLACPHNEKELWQTLDFVDKKSLKMVVIGDATNILFNDQDFEGLILNLSGINQKPEVIENGFETPAGERLCSFIAFCRKMGCSGFDAMQFIPGTVGGAIANNAGAGEICISDYLKWVEGIDLNSRKFIRKQKNELIFSYRKSSLRGNFIITKAAFMVPEKESSCDLKALALYRRRQQPYRAKSAGCVFKNPDGDSAGRLIEAAGCKNIRCGNARVSEKHANFIVNDNNCSSADVRELIRIIETRVKEKFNIQLQRELQFFEELVL